MAEIKKVVQRVYQFDFSKCTLIDGNEMISTEHGNEFVNTFIKRDIDKGIIVTPAGYSKGMIYKTTNGGEIASPSSWFPDIINFAFNVYGLKKNSYYRLTVKAKNYRKYNSLTDVTSDRSLEVSNDNQELLIKKDLSEVMEYEDFEVIFKASSAEENLYFRIGKIAINDIILDEVELPLDDIKDDDNPPTVEFENGKSNIVAFGVFSNESVSDNNKFSELTRITGKGINLYYNKADNEYVLERDNYEDSVGCSFTGANYVVEFNLNKAPFATYRITAVSPDISPNTLKQGFIKFQIADDGKYCRYDRTTGRVAIIIRKIL